MTRGRLSLRVHIRREAAMTEEKKEQPKNIAVDLECDDEFEEFGNEGASRVFARVEIATQFVPEISPGLPSSLPPFLTRTRERLRPTEWGAEEEDAEDVKQWEEDWDDTDANDDFTRQLRAELERHQ